MVSDQVKGQSNHAQLTKEKEKDVSMLSTTKTEDTVALLLLVCVSLTIIGQPRNNVLIRRV